MEDAGFDLQHHKNNGANPDFIRFLFLMNTILENNMVFVPYTPALFLIKAHSYIFL